MRANRNRLRARRRGFSLVEIAVACVLFGTMAIIALQVIGWVATDRQAISRREGATRVVSNLMERILAHPWADQTAAGLAPLADSARGSKSLAATQLRVEVTPAAPIDGRASRKILVEVVWPDRMRVAEAPIRLVAWTFQRQGDQP